MIGVLQLREAWAVICAACLAQFNSFRHPARLFALTLYRSESDVALYEQLVANERDIFFREIVNELSTFFPDRESLAIRVLDLGSGTCRFAQTIIRARPLVHVTCVDISAAMLRRGRELNNGSNNIQFVRSDLTEFMHTERNQYDLILCTAVAQFIEDPGEAIAAIARRLAPGGLVVFRALRPNLRNRIRTSIWRVLSGGLSSARLELFSHLSSDLEKSGFKLRSLELPDPLCQNMVALIGTREPRQRGPSRE